MNYEEIYINENERYSVIFDFSMNMYFIGNDLVNKGGIYQDFVKIINEMKLKDSQEILKIVFEYEIKRSKKNNGLETNKTNRKY